MLSGVFRKERKVDKDARCFMAFIQVVLVQQIYELTKQQETGVLALVHGIALLFLDLEREENNGWLQHDYVMNVKEQIIMTNLNFAFGKKEITQERVEDFTKMVYTVLKQTGCNGKDTGEIATAKIYESFCSCVELTEEGQEKAGSMLRRLQIYFNKEMQKIERMKGVQY